MTRSLLFGAMLFSFALNVPAKASTPPTVITGAPVYDGCDSCGAAHDSRHLWDDFCFSRRKHHFKHHMVQSRPLLQPSCSGCELPKLHLPKWNWPKWSSHACTDCQTVYEPVENSCADCSTGFKFPHFRMPQFHMPHLACHKPHWDWKSSCATVGRRLDPFGLFRHHHRGNDCCDASGEEYFEGEPLESYDGQMAPAAESDANPADTGPAIAPANPLPMPPPVDEARHQPSTSYLRG